MNIRSIRALLIAMVALVLSSASFGQVRISVTFGPPALPVYEQPICPGEGYIWTPGFWAWSDDDRGLLLGARHLGVSSGSGVALDPAVLGLGRWWVCFL